MEDITNGVLEKMNGHKQQLLKLMANQDEITTALVALEKNYDAGNITQEELDNQLEVLIPRHERQQKAIESTLAEIEWLRQRIFVETGLELPPIM